MQLSGKQITFCNFLAGFLKLKFNFKFFEKKDDPRTLCISESTDSERRD